MIFQSRNTKGKIKKSTRLKNEPLDSDNKFNNSVSVRFFSYFIFLLLGIILGFIFFQYYTIDTKKIDYNVFEKKLDTQKSKSRKDKIEKSQDFENLNNDLLIKQTNFQKLIDSRLMLIEKKISNFDEVSKKFIIDLNSLTKKNEKKIDSDIISINSKINQANKNINNIISTFDRLNKMELILDKKIKYFSVTIGIHNLRESISNNFNVSSSLNDLKNHIESLNNKNYINLFLKLENLINTGIKNRDELIYLLNNIEKITLEENIIPINSNKLESPAKYFSSLVKIKKLKNSDGRLVENTFIRTRALLYQNKLSEAVVELGKTPLKDNKNINDWLIQCNKLIQVEKLMGDLLNINFEFERRD
ncbi:MAG: hypothetical protein CFH01_00570 [Alphaproteobacteria bacterium MarineAlpha2_Bin1]|nr:MAG: hypothetical protein CFH01_00570 [Alphaproteobacteria bacterium MarineAlpha2_Bin1]